MPEIVINETLKASMELEKEEYPDQLAEMRVEFVTKELLHFIYRVTGAGLMQTEAEAEVVRFDVAMELLKSFQRHTNSDLLNERLSNRLESYRYIPNFESNKPIQESDEEAGHVITTLPRCVKIKSGKMAGARGYVVTTVDEGKEYGLALVNFVFDDLGVSRILLSDLETVEPTKEEVEYLNKSKV